MLSAPSSGPTLRSSTTVSGAGSAPARSSTARSVAEAAVKLPLIWPRPPVIGSRITGALITLSSSTMANGWFDVGPRDIGEAPRADRVEGEVRPPTRRSAGWSRRARRSGRRRRRRPACAPRSSASGCPASAGNRRPAAARRRPSALAASSTKRNVMCAVLPSSCLIRSGSPMPGKLHDDAVVALLGDLRVEHAGLVDAPAHDLDRLLHRPRRARLQRHRRQRQQ